MGGFCWERKAGLPLRPGHNQTAGMIANILGTLKKRRKEEKKGEKDKKETRELLVFFVVVIQG